MIRRMKPSDVPQIAELEKCCFSDPWSEASIASELENPLSLWLVEERDGVVAGYIGSQTVPPESDVMNVAVSPAFRRQGIGRSLLCALMERLQGMESLTLEVRASNAPAIALYTQLGFQQVGRRPGYYIQPREDALILRKELSQC